MRLPAIWLLLFLNSGHPRDDTLSPPFESTAERLPPSFRCQLRSLFRCSDA